MRNLNIDRQKVQGQQGFTLVEVLVVTVIMMMIGACMASMLSIMNRELTYSNSKMGKISLVHDLSAVVTNPDLCKKALAFQALPNLPSDPSAISPIVFKLDDTSIDGSVETDLPLYKLTVKDLFLTQIAAAGKMKGLPLYTANLAFDATEMSNGQSGAAASTKRLFQRSQVAKIFLQLASASDRTIIACFSSGGNDNLLQMVCESMGGTFDATKSQCSGTGKACELGGNPYGPAIFTTIDNKPRTDESIAAILGVGKDIQFIGGSQQYTSTLDDSSRALVTSLRNGGGIPSGMQLGTGMMAVCLDGKWVDSGVVATTASTPHEGGDGGNGIGSSGDAGDGGD